MADGLFDPAAMLRVLDEHGVEVVLIGGFAAALHGSPALTHDADFCPRRERANLARLASALRAMNARIRTVDAPGGLPFACDAIFLSQVEIVNLVTDHGDLDLSFFPSGTSGYEELRRDAVVYDLDGVRVTVASLDAIIRSKEAADREQDRRTLPLLYALRDEIGRRDG